MDVRVNDILTMKKPHPCGRSQRTVLRSGMAFRLRCLGCGHEVLVARAKAAKNIRRIQRPESCLDPMDGVSAQNPKDLLAPGRGKKQNRANPAHWPDKRAENRSRFLSELRPVFLRLWGYTLSGSLGREVRR